MEYRLLDENGPAILIPKVWKDARGYFMETFRQNDFVSHFGEWHFVQDNQSKSTGGVLRGLHYQLAHPQGKLVRVISGEVFDVAVDIRQSSPNFGKIYGVSLNNRDHHIFWVPPGFAHGFYVTSQEAEFVYKCTEYYDPQNERCILWNDPDLQINWPLDSKKPTLSEKDLQGVPFREAELFK